MEDACVDVMSFRNVAIRKDFHWPTFPLGPRRSRPCTLYITSVATTRSNGPVSSSDLVDDDSTPTGSVHVRSGQRLHCRPRFARVTSSAPMPGEDDQNPTVFRRKSPNKFSVGEAADRSLT